MRHQNGFGSIVCLDKTGKKRRKPWAVRITTGWKDGKQVRKYIGYYKTQKEALIALADYHKNGYDIDLSNLTLDEVWKLWIEGVESKDLSASVMRNHNATYGKLGTLLSKQMKDIKTAQLQRWMNDIDLKPSTKGKMKNSMQQVFDYAIKNDIVVKNYADFIEINEKVEHNGSIFSDDEIQVLWKNIDMIGVRELLILIYTGMRIGEMLAISSDNIHFDEGYIIGGNKTSNGKNRVIPLHTRILTLVKQQLSDNKWLMQSNRGVAMSYKNASLRLNKVFDTFGFNHKIHDTRRTAISIMHTSGIPIETIRIIVGHSGKGVTEKVYLYKEPKELVDIINTLEIPY